MNIPAPAKQISTHIWRLTAPNPGPMTAEGTNTYLIRAVDRFAVIDAGPDIEMHKQAILAATGGAKNIAMLLVTHMHPDHSPAAADPLWIVMAKRAS